MEIVELLLIIYLLVQNKVKELRTRKNLNKEVEAVTALTEKKKKEDMELEYDKDLVAIDSYMDYVKSIIDKYNGSRNKRVARNTRQKLLSETLKIMPLFAKYITVDFYYDGENEVLSKITEKELMAMLESAYNDFTHDNLESFNNMITLILKLRDLV